MYIRFGYVLLYSAIKQNTMTDETKAKNIYLNANLQPPKATKIKKGTRVEFVNQDLEEAIKQMKQAIKNKSTTNIGMSQTKALTNPEKNLESLRNSQKMFYTQTYKKKMELRLNEIEERKRQLTTNSLEKQMKARLLRKIEQNTELQEKMEILKEVQQRRDLILIQKSQKQKRRKEEQQMLHESSKVNAEMFRKSKKKALKNQLKESRINLVQSMKDLKFKGYLTQKQKQQRQILLNSRLQFMIRNKTATGLRGQLETSRSQRNSTISLYRPLKTSHLARAVDKQHRADEEQDLIIKQYATKQSHEQQREASQKDKEEPKSQKKYNSLVRKIQESANKQSKVSEIEQEHNQALEKAQ